jgi:2,3-bisphosphoglycerate-independent phosphoglycerate mutase
VPRVLLVFVDGVGLGDDDPAFNALLTARLPVLGGLLRGRAPTRDAAPHHAVGASLVGVDATLGIDGTPQSGTGQATLLTGANAAEMHGRHFGPWVPARLQRMVREESVLAAARASGYQVAFANAYPEEVLTIARPRPADTAPAPTGLPLAGVEAAEGGEGAAHSAPGAAQSAAGAAQSAAGDAAARLAARRRRRAPSFLRAGPPLAALGAGVLTRHTRELARGDAVASEITNEGWREVLGRTQLPVIDAAHAGRNLGRIAASNDLTLFAHYATDYAGHRRSLSAAEAALERLDAFLGGVLEELPRDALLFVVSDHGNLEDTRVGHTRNPALGLVAGNGHALLSRRLRSLTDITPTILDTLAL